MARLAVFHRTFPAMTIPAVRRLSLILFVLALVVITGCKDDLITEYDAPREEQERLLAAMMTRGDTTWSFKLTGTANDVAAQKEHFEKFVAGVRFKGDDKAEPTFPTELPDGWKRDKTESPQRFAAFEVTGTEPALEVTVVRTSGPSAADVLKNVNRWRGQMSLREIIAAELPQCTRETTVDGLVTTFVDVSGPGDMRPKKMGGTANAPTYTVPTGWTKKENPPDKMPGMTRVATFEAGDGAQVAEVSVVVSAGMGDINMNIERWRGQVGLPQAKSVDELDRHVQRDFKLLGGLEATYVDITGPGAEGKAPSRILAVLARRGLQYWAVKMQGPPDVVDKQKRSFDEFLGSFRFPEVKPK
jgi:hypothetical protein